MRLHIYECVCIYIYICTYILCVCVYIYINTEQVGLSHNFCGFSGSSADKESASNAGDTGSIPGLGRSPGEGNSYLLQYSWALLVAQMVKNLPAMRETWDRSLGWEDPLEKGTANHSSILAWRIPYTEEPAWLESDTTEQLSLLSLNM